MNTHLSLPTLSSLRRHASSHPDEGSSSNTRATSKQGSTSGGKHGKPLPSGDEQPDEWPDSDDDDENRPPDRSPSPEADPQDPGITHDTNITLKISVNGKYKEQFVKLESSVKVCEMIVQNISHVSTVLSYP
jgi:hypothetical protein